MTIEFNKQKSSIRVVTDKISDVTSKPVFIFSAGFVLGYLTKYIVHKTQKILSDKIINKVFKKKNN